ncbi:MAG: ThiF family adenylyltransferase [bacterium]
MTESSKRHIVLVGCGGNVGSHVVGHLGRLENVGRVTLVDSDVYEFKNLRTQDIAAADVGRPKAVVQAERLRRINPDLTVKTFQDSVENVPLGCLDGDVILAAVDSRRARQVINIIARRLNLPWLDSGVDGDRLFARVTVYFPGREASCLECGWGEQEYRDLKTRYPCTRDEAPRVDDEAPRAPDGTPRVDDEAPRAPDGTPREDAAPAGSTASGKAPATNAPSSLGALAASLLVIECSKILAGKGLLDSAGYEVFMEAKYHNLYPATLAFNPDCRLPEHRSGSIKPLSGFETRAIDTTLAELLQLEDAGDEAPVHGGAQPDAEGPRRPVHDETRLPGIPQQPGQGETPADRAPRLRVVGQRFVTRLTCQNCGHGRAYVRLRVSLRSDGAYKCDRCGGDMIATGFDTADQLNAERLSLPTVSRTLRSIGIRDGDVICVSRPNGLRRYVVARNGTHRAKVARVG